MKPKNRDIEAIIIPNRIITSSDPKTGAPYCFFPFMFPDGTPGNLVIIKQKPKCNWQPFEDIESVDINWKKVKV